MGGILNATEQVLDDLIIADKSELFSSIFIEAADALEQQGASLYFTQSFVIAVNTSGEIQFENENAIISFVSACAGIPLDAGTTPEIKDEIKTYSFYLICLIIIPIVAIIVSQYRNSGTTEKSKVKSVIANKMPQREDKAVFMQDTYIQRSSKPVLYAKTPQHNNIPYALHGTPIVIGRNPVSCKVVFAKDTVGISGEHCSVSYDEKCGEFILTDLNSTCGTYLLNGAKLRANQQYHLKANESFYLGDKCNIFSLEVR